MFEKFCDVLCLEKEFITVEIILHMELL